MVQHARLTKNGCSKGVLLTLHITLWKKHEVNNNSNEQLLKEGDSLARVVRWIKEVFCTEIFIIRVGKGALELTAANCLVST